MVQSEQHVIYTLMVVGGHRGQGLHQVECLGVLGNQL